MEIQELHNYTQAQFEDLTQLMTELSDRVNVTQSDLMLVLRDCNCHLYVILDGEHIVGCATLAYSIPQQEQKHRLRMWWFRLPIAVSILASS